MGATAEADVMGREVSPLMTRDLIAFQTQDCPGQNQNLTLPGQRGERACAGERGPGGDTDRALRRRGSWTWMQAGADKRMERVEV